MARIREWLGRLWHTLRPRRTDGDLYDELRAHLTLAADEARRRGASAVDAHRAARVAAGGSAQALESLRDQRGLPWLGDLAQDLRYGGRTLRTNPGFAAVAIATIAVGVGANTAIFSVVDAVLLRPLPVTAPERLVLFSDESSEGTQTSTRPPEERWHLFSTDAYEFLRAQPLPLESVAAFAPGENTVDVRRHEPGPTAMEGRRAEAHLVSGTYFTVMAAAPALGRVLLESDDRPAAPPVAVASDGFWRDYLEADPRAVGRTLAVNDLSFTIVGIMPAAFFGERVRRSPDLWVPLTHQPGIQRRPVARARPDLYWLSLIGRLGPGQTQAGAEAAATASLRQFLATRADASADGEGLRSVERVHVALVSGARGISLLREQNIRPLSVLLGAVGLVLVLACANVATLFLARATARQDETLIRRALGASRSRLTRQWLTESLLVAASGAVAGVWIATLVAPALVAVIAPASTPVAVRLDSTVLLFSLGVTALASVLFGLVPAFRVGRTDLLPSLRLSGRGSRRRRWMLGVAEPFVIVQIALALVLVVGAALLARTLMNLERAPLGFDRDRVLLARINPRLAGFTPADVGGLYERLHARLVAIPGVEHATLARYSPFGGSRSVMSAAVDGYTPRADENVALESILVGPDYPQTLGMPIVAGRAIGVDDGRDAPLVAMVNEAFVQRFAPGSNAIGRRVRFGDDFHEIVGVIGDAPFHDVREPATPLVFTPMLQERGQMALDCEIEVRTAGDASAITALVRQAVADVDSRLVVTRARTLGAQVRATFATERTATGALATFAGLGLLLAGVGLYGLVAHGVSQRTSEIGIRMALGALPSNVLWLLLRESLARLAIGLALGVMLTIGAGRVLASQLFGVATTDAVSMALAVLVLSCITILTSLVPAVRAVRSNPLASLRAD